MKTFEVKVNVFSGPIETLLQLIEERKLSIMDLSIAEVTADFLKHIEIISAADKGEDGGGIFQRLIADFLVVAAQLLLIKSKILLPSLELTNEEEEGIKDLEERLRMLKLIKEHGGHMSVLWRSKDISLSRPLFKGLPVIFYPAKNINLKSLENVLGALMKTIQAETKEVKIIRRSLISLEEKIDEILNRLMSASKSGGLAFHHLSKERSREEIVVLFLALLHLLEKRMVRIEQESHFGQITLKAN